MDRRRFLQLTTVAATGLGLGFGLSGCAEDEAQPATPTTPPPTTPAGLPAPAYRVRRVLGYDADAATYSVGATRGTLVREGHWQYTSPGGGPNQLSAPVAVAMLGEAVGVLDRGRGALLAMSPDTGVILREVLAYGDVPLGAPRGLVPDPDGNLQVLDPVHSRLCTFDQEMREVRVTGDRDRWGAPGAVAVGADGNLHVLDRLRRQVVVIDRSGADQGRWGGPDVFTRPGDLITLTDGTFVVADADRGLVHVSADGTLIDTQPLNDGLGRAVQPRWVRLALDGRLLAGGVPAQP